MADQILKDYDENGKRYRIYRVESAPVLSPRDFEIVVDHTEGANAAAWHVIAQERAAVKKQALYDAAVAASARTEDNTYVGPVTL